LVLDRPKRKGHKSPEFIQSRTVSRHGEETETDKTQGQVLDVGSEGSHNPAGDENSMNTANQPKESREHSTSKGSKFLAT